MRRRSEGAKGTVDTYRSSPWSQGNLPNRIDMEPPQLAGVVPGRFRSFKQDFLASVVVFLVALPLCMGIARLKRPGCRQKPITNSCGSD